MSAFSYCYIVRKQLAPNFFGDFLHQGDFCPLFFFGELVADFAAGKAALRGKAQILGGGTNFDVSVMRAFTVSLSSRPGCLEVMNDHDWEIPVMLLLQWAFPITKCDVLGLRDRPNRSGFAAFPCGK